MTELITMPVWAMWCWLTLAGVVGAGLAVIVVSWDTVRRYDRRSR